MELTFTVTKTVTTASASGCQRLFHGTLTGNVGSLVTHGIDYQQLREFGGSGDFWAAEDVEDARNAALMAEAQLLFRGGPPGQVIVSFDVQTAVLESFKAPQPNPLLWVYSHGYCFKPPCYSTLNRAMQNIEITFEQ